MDSLTRDLADACSRRRAAQKAYLTANTAYITLRQRIIAATSRAEVEELERLMRLTDDLAQSIGRLGNEIDELGWCA
jgi:hypothetical protein